MLFRHVLRHVGPRMDSPYGHFHPAVFWPIFLAMPSVLASPVFWEILSILSTMMTSQILWDLSTVPSSGHLPLRSLHRCQLVYLSAAEAALVAAAVADAVATAAASVVAVAVAVAASMLQAVRM